MNTNLNSTDKLKLGMAIAMLICLFQMPYGYYQLVRIGSAIGFAYLASTLKEDDDKLRWIYIGLAVLFQPLVKISLGRGLWNIVDVVVGIWLLKNLYKSHFDDNN